MVYKVEPVGNNLWGDLHEFKLTVNGTALVTIYDVTSADLSSIGGPTDGRIFDGVFQEIHVETGELIFEWRASEHHHVNESQIPVTYRTDSDEDVFDFFHINSVDKDALGNYYVSSRHTCSVICISPSGDIQWVLGGNRNEFTDLSSGAATNFNWQHHARWHPDNTITIFSNNGYDYNRIARKHSRGLSIRLDISNKTAEVVETFVDSQHTSSYSQGSFQTLSGTGNVLIGYGHCAAFTEFSPTGEVVCDVHYGASSLFEFGRINSYRVFKGSWVGKPMTSPAVRVSGGKLYVSWNGATEVAEWQLHGAIALELGEMAEFEVLEIIRKRSFEESFLTPIDYDEDVFRVVAVDCTGEVLGTSDLIYQDMLDEPTSPYSVFLVGTVATTLIVGSGLFLLRRHLYNLVGLLDLGRYAPVPTDDEPVVHFLNDGLIQR